ncbi:hypothetical protein BATDEDRAFT_11731 [Batrachochytrium dendrobatidis JAM81]|uniref:Uricase n=1 Tax=Batrachochytrium dendrobatidis (strain JAM81 / FGSC 10211) TaxID=684364 RepID=F4P2L1_BATDJ|nr:uncharacterized protein BATDEDRAFT_11731 [Batrachochytrium dendrobatidis JAM81]EGF80481.1 hypothetical protein BATDEDRAFT_11731 [Batrachochytrium dendrobatidis JAM81]|eukprot:XP_006678890.1 hypothetical protein BATDEDRAFT_11731 [Batrachochytrium dendrobatidis JAM81]
MSAFLSSQQYGKDKVRLVKVTDLPASTAHGATNLKHQHVQELTCRVLLAGAQFETSYTKADNRLVVPTDTVKNTIYYLAQTTQDTLEDIESFAKVIGRHFIKQYAHVEEVHVRIHAHNWTRIQTSTLEPVPTLAHPHSFYRAGEQKRTTNVVATRVQSRADAMIKFSIASGISDLYVLKSSGSSFEDYHLDKLTTLPPMSERVLSTDITATWTFPDSVESLTQNPSKPTFTPTFHTIKQITLDLFANHNSPSVQNTLYRMGELVLASCPHVKDITYELPNKHVFVYDLKRFGVTNQTGGASTVYYPVADPSGLITATISRSRAKL